MRYSRRSKALLQNMTFLEKLYKPLITSLFKDYFALRPCFSGFAENKARSGIVHLSAKKRSDKLISMNCEAMTS